MQNEYKNKKGNTKKCYMKNTKKVKREKNAEKNSMKIVQYQKDATWN